MGYGEWKLLTAAAMSGYLYLAFSFMPNPDNQKRYMWWLLGLIPGMGIVHASMMALTDYALG